MRWRGRASASGRPVGGSPVGAGDGRARGAGTSRASGRDRHAARPERVERPGSRRDGRRTAAGARRRGTADRRLGASRRVGDGPSGPRSPSRPPRMRSRRPRRLLDLDRGAGLFQLLLELLGVVLRDARLDRLGGGLDQVLGLLEAQAGGGADDLDDVDLVGAEGLQDDVELGLGGDRLGGGGGGGGGRRPTAAAAALIPWTSSR